MTARYRLTETAEEDGIDRALHVHGKFVGAFGALAAMSGIGSKRLHLTGERVRWCTVFRWVVIYDPEASPITILRVIHGARGLDRVLRPDK